MEDLAIRAENISKKYIIGQRASGSLRERISSLFSSQKTVESTFWALKNIDFEIKKGEAVGIIGRNGAGKSTLLKILSQITYPTTGEIEINGQVASLLEVGTGFHQELTGRENIYLNGTILGMSRKEVKSKMTEIIDFSGVEKFIDTPVKHYSSGMYVRLAFAVAAHLEPEILIIDEVLAVGDAEFQKKCLGKMDDVANSGKTVIFVSHNMAAVRNLCDVGIVINEGQILFKGPVDEAIQKYNHLSVSDKKEFNLQNIKRTRGTQIISIAKVELNAIIYYPNSEFEAVIHLIQNDKSVAIKNVHIAVFIVDAMQNILYHLSTMFLDNEHIPLTEVDGYSFSLNRLNLSSGTYNMWVWLQGNGFEQDYVESEISFEVSDGNIYGSNSPKIISIIQKEFHFQIKK